MLHELGRDGKGAIVKMVQALHRQFPGKNIMLIEVEDFDPLQTQTDQSPLKNPGRLDYHLIHYLSLQGMPRTKNDWNSIFKEAGSQIVEPGIAAGNLFIYIIKGHA